MLGVIVELSKKGTPSFTLNVPVLSDPSDRKKAFTIYPSHITVNPHYLRLVKGVQVPVRALFGENSRVTAIEFDGSRFEVKGDPRHSLLFIDLVVDYLGRGFQTKPRTLVVAKNFSAAACEALAPTGVFFAKNMKLAKTAVGLQ